MSYTVSLVYAVPGVRLPHLHFLLATWTDSTDPNAASTNVYRSTVSGGPYTLIANVALGVQQFKDTNVLLGTQYFYVTTEVDINSNESGFSTEQSGIITG